MTSTNAAPSAQVNDLGPALGLKIRVPSGLLINGEWVTTDDKIVVNNPATGEVLCEISSATPELGQRALDAASAAQSEWASTPSRVRSDILSRAFDYVTEHADDFARLMTLEMGKPLAEALGEVKYGAEFIRWFAEEAPRSNGRYQVNPEGTQRILVTKRPVGPCLFITPWNFPLAMATRKLAPAIAAGCTSVIKPPALTPLTTLAFAAVLEDAGVPAGVVNVIQTSTSSAVTTPLIKSPQLRKLSFTGSTPVGRRLLETASERVLRTSMELGGNAPLIVFEDADLDKAIAGTLLAKLRNMGEACTAANRIIVHESIAEEYTKRLATEFAALKCGNGLDPDTKLGPLVDENARKDVHGLVADAIAQGAEVVVGGAIPEGPGYFYPATILRNIPKAARITTEEIFGPVAPIFTFSTEAEAIEIANSTEYGLASYVFTKDVTRALRLAEKLEYGMLGVNQGVMSNAAAPFGGVKESGLGREGGLEGLAEFQETMYIALEI
ncbi:NAD-dependent succinate-semialdehyde dehydrogenase [Micrococcales bacterium 31B]|nr:NAD-dependent succinate-semialdehyde dehydrogenase [Micrococcales bacterium 31B]